MPAPDQGQVGQSNNAAQKLALIQAKIGTGTGPAAVQTLINELQNALEEVDERKSIEATLRQQVTVLEDRAFSLGTALEIENNDHVARTNRANDIENLRMLRTDFGKALSALETANPLVDTKELALVAVRLESVTEHIDQFQGFLDGSAETQIKRQKGRTAYHRNRAIVLRTERNIAQATLARILKDAQKTLADKSNPDLAKSREAASAVEAAVANALIEMQALLTDSDVPKKQIDPENEDDAADAAEDKNTNVAMNFLGVEDVIESFSQIAEAIAAGKKIQAVPATPTGTIQALGGSTLSADARVKAAEDAAEDAKKKAAAAEATAAVKSLETTLCNDKLNKLKQQITYLQANGSGFDEQTLASYLKIAKDNLVYGQILIDRIKSLESCKGCSANNGKKRKRCNGDYASVSPEVFQDLIKHLNDEISPQADLVAKITDLLSALRTRVENRPQRSSSGGSPAPTSAHQSSSGPRPEVIMGNTGGLDSILQINNSTLENGAILLKRIASLESQLHILKNHAGGSTGGCDDDCPKELEKMRKQLEDTLSDLSDKGWEIEQLQAELEKTKVNLRDCEDAEGNAYLRELGRLEAEIQNLKAKIAALQAKGHANDTTSQDRLKEKDLEIQQLLKDRDAPSGNYQLCKERTENVLNPEIQRLKAHITALQVEDLNCPIIPQNHYKLLLAKIDNLEESLKVCEELRRLEGVKDKDEIELAKEDELASLEKEELLQHLQQQNTVIGALRRDLDAIKSKLVDQRALQAEIYMSNDLIDRLQAVHDERVENNIKILTKLHQDHESELAKGKYMLEKTQKEMARQRDEIDNLKRRLRDGQEFKKKVTSLGIDDPEEPGDHEGLDNQTLIQEILDLQGKLKACGIALIECENVRERDRRYIPSDEELDEDLVNQDQNRSQRIQDLEIEVRRLKMALSCCQENESARTQALQDQITTMENEAYQKEATYQEKVSNPEEAKSMDILKQGIRQLRAKAADAKDKLKDCEENEAFLTKTLRDQLKKMEKEVEREKEQSKKQEEEEDEYESKISQLQHRISELEGDLYECRAENEIQTRVKDYIEGKLQESQFEVERLESQLTPPSPVPSSLESDTDQVKKLKEELVECKSQAANRDERLRERAITEATVVDWIEKYNKLKAAFGALQKEIDNLKKNKAQNGNSETIRVEIERLKQELLTQQQNCEAEKETLHERIKKLQGKISTPEGAGSTDILKLKAETKRLQEELLKTKGDLKNEAARANSFKKAMEMHHDSLEKERMATAKCNEKLAALRAQHPGSGLGNPTRTSATANEEKDNCLEYEGEVARLKHLVANLNVEKSYLTKQSKEQKQLIEELTNQLVPGYDDSGDDCWVEVARLKELIASLEVEKASLQEQLQDHEHINAELTSHIMEDHSDDDDGDEEENKDENSAKRSLAMAFNDVYPDNAAYNNEIEALNNQITSQKQVIAALQQQAALDKLEIDALKESNTNTSKAYQKFVALVEKLRAELDDLNAKLAECSAETWQERRARMRRLAAANRGPRKPTTRRLDPAITQVKEWEKNGWWKFERPARKRRRIE